MFVASYKFFGSLGSSEKEGVRKYQYKKHCTDAYHEDVPKYVDEFKNAVAQTNVSSSLSLTSQGGMKSNAPYLE